MIKGLIPQEDIMVFDMHAPNDRVSKYMRQKSKKNTMRNKETHYSRLDYSFFSTERSNKHKINKDADEPNSIINQLDLTDT